MKQKLQGYEGSSGESLSVQGQVKRLIAEAQDPDSLSRMYFGWQPWV